MSNDDQLMADYYGRRAPLYDAMYAKITPDTRSLLVGGVLDAGITQHPQTMVANCARIFSNLRDKRDVMSGVEPVRISVITRENLP